MITCSCPECGYRYKVADDLAGKSVLCPECQTRLTVKRSAPARPRPEEEDQDDEGAQPRQGRATGIPVWVWVAGASALALLVLVVPLAVVAVVLLTGKDAPPPVKGAQAPQQRVPPAAGDAQPPQQNMPADDMTLAAYLAQRPDKPTRITLDCKLDNYYNFAYRGAAATHYSVSLSQASPSKFGHAWMPKDCEAGRAVFEVLKDGREHRLTLAVALRGPDGMPTPAGREELAVVRYFAPSGQVYEVGGQGEGQADADAPPVATLPKQELFNAYHDNEAAADLKFTGKVVEVQEVCAPLFDYIPRKDQKGSYYLDFNCGVGWVRATFRDSEREKLARFDQHMGGTRLTVRGKCRGISGNTVQILDAVLVSVEKGFKPEWRN
jgi:hypothetical protein